jgi:hypothetical protein
LFAQKRSHATADFKERRSSNRQLQKTATGMLRRVHAAHPAMSAATAGPTR